MNTYPRVDLTYHADGNVGIGTPPDASAPVMGEPVERIRFMMSNQEPEAHVFAHPTTEWARVDKDLNVTHLDMELCAKGPQNVYTALALAIWNKAIAQEREACAELVWPMQQVKVWSDKELTDMTVAFNRTQEKHGYGWYETIMAVGATALKDRAAAIRARGEK